MLKPFWTAKPEQCQCSHSPSLLQQQIRCLSTKTAPLKTQLPLSFSMKWNEEVQQLQKLKHYGQESHVGRLRSVGTKSCKRPARAGSCKRYWLSQRSVLSRNGNKQLNKSLFSPNDHVLQSQWPETYQHPWSAADEPRYVIALMSSDPALGPKQRLYL